MAACGVHLRLGCLVGVLYASASPCLAADLPTIALANGKSAGGEGSVVIFPVTLSQPSAVPVTVGYFTGAWSDTATAGADYLASTGTLVFSPGQTSSVVSVIGLDDLTSEGEEYFTLALSAPVGATLSRSSAFGVVIDDDAELGCYGELNCIVRFPILGVYNPSTGAWEPGAGSVRVTIDSGFSPSDYAQREDELWRWQGEYYLGDGSAVTSSGRVEFPGGWPFSDWQCYEEFAFVDDGTFVLTYATVSREVEWYSAAGGFYAEDYTVSMPDGCWDRFDHMHEHPDLIQRLASFNYSEPGYRFGPATFDPEPSISIGDARSAGEAGTVEFRVSLDAPTTARVTVGYSTADGPAVAGADYVAADGSLTFEPGQLTKTVSVTILPDALLEGDETFDLVLSNPVGAHLARSVATGTIEDDDEGPLATLRLPQTAISGCLKTTGSITLAAPAPAGGLVVSLSSDNPHAVVPDRISFKPGVVKKSFPIVTSPVITRETVTIEASALGQTISGAFTIKPMLPKSVTLSPTSVVGGGSVIGTVTLQCPAGPGDILVALSSSNPAVATPATSSVLIPAGVKAMPFDVTTMPVDQVRKVSIKAAANGMTRVRTLTVTPVP